MNVLVAMVLATIGGYYREGNFIVWWWLTSYGIKPMYIASYIAS